MDQNEHSIQHISDTALWVAAYRARESERLDAIFKDPLAQRLAGNRGEQIARKFGFEGQNSWPFVARTFAFDQIIADRVRDGTDMVVNLAAGLDTRPYRMDLPASLGWVEVDLPAILDYKEEILQTEKPKCALDRVRLDLSNAAARRQIFEQLGRTVRRALVVTEGLLVYLSAEEVTSLARDLVSVAGFEGWALDLVSPGLLLKLQKSMGTHLSQSGAVLQFGPLEGPEYFVPCGWRPVKIYSMLKTAAQLKRLPFWMRPLAWLPESTGRQGSRPWGGVCLFRKAQSS